MKQVRPAFIYPTNYLVALAMLASGDLPHDDRKRRGDIFHVQPLGFGFCIGFFIFIGFILYALWLGPGY